MAPMINNKIRVGYNGINRSIVISFGKKPLRGGIPLIDIIIIGIINDIWLYELQAFCSWGCVFTDIRCIVVNRGIRRILYIK